MLVAHSACLDQAVQCRPNCEFLESNAEARLDRFLACPDRVARASCLSEGRERDVLVSLERGLAAALEWPVLAERADRRKLRRGGRHVRNRRVIPGRRPSGSQPCPQTRLEARS